MATSRDLVARLKARGFDRSKSIPFEKGARVGCSQCEAVCVNGVPCHETCCPNAAREKDKEDEEE